MGAESPHHPLPGSTSHRSGLSALSGEEEVRDGESIAMSGLSSVVATPPQREMRCRADWHGPGQSETTDTSFKHVLFVLGGATSAGRRLPIGAGDLQMCDVGQQPFRSKANANDWVAACHVGQRDTASRLGSNLTRAPMSGQLLPAFGHFWHRADLGRNRPECGPMPAKFRQYSARFGTRSSQLWTMSTGFGPNGAKPWPGEGESWASLAKLGPSLTTSGRCRSADFRRA